MLKEKQPDDRIKTNPIIKEIIINASVEKVWKAITDKDEMKQWYFDIAEFKPEAGFEFTFSPEMDGKKWLHLCKIVEVIYEKKISYSWRYDGYVGDSLVTFELYREGDRTKLRLTHEGIETFSSDFPYSKEKFKEGWEQLIGVSLKDF